MGAFDNLLSGVAGVSKSDRGRTARRGRQGGGGDLPSDLDDAPLWVRKAVSRGLQIRRGREENGRVYKQEVDRKASLPQALQNALDENDAAPKPYDPALMRDLSSSPVPQTYIDTLAQDAASADWTLRAMDEDAEVDRERINEVERRLRDLVPDSTFPEFLEEWSRNILRLGDGTVVKHYPGGDPSNEVGEIVHIDSATMFKRLDEGGYPAGYVQMTASESDKGMATGDEFEGTPLELEEVVWVSWARRGNHVYGQGPVEKGKDTIEILEEILEKELLDLIQGMPPGILSRPPDTEVSVPSEDWENFKDDMKLNRGERHRLAFTEWPVDYTPLTPNYQELQLLDRYKSKVTELGGVFKTNPSYAGFEFENVNRATDESQQEAYKQRGFQVLINRLEAALTFGVLPDLGLDLGTDLRFEFERERTTSEKQDRANYLREAVNAGKEAANAGLDVAWKNGQVVVEEGTIEEGNAGSSGGGEGGGLFGSETAGRTFAESDREIATLYEKNTGLDHTVVLGFPAGGVAHSGEGDTWARFLNELLDRGADKIVDLNESMGGTEVAYPDDRLPSAEDPLLAVHGLPKETVNTLLQSNENIHLQIFNTGMSKAESGEGNGNSGEARTPLTKEEVEKLDEILFETHKEQIFPASADDIVEKRVFSPGEVPDYVREKIQEAIESGAVFQGFESVGENVQRVRELVEDILEDNLLDDDGWSLREIRDDIQESFPNATVEEAERIARTETASTLNTARELGYEEREDAATLKFEWVGPSDSRTTDACEFMKQGSDAVDDPPFGFEGTHEQPLPMDELKRVEKKAADYYFPSLSYRTHVLHPDERHTFKRVIEGVA